MRRLEYFTAAVAACLVGGCFAALPAANAGTVRSCLRETVVRTDRGFAFTDITASFRCHTARAVLLRLTHNDNPVGGGGTAGSWTCTLGAAVTAHSRSGECVDGGDTINYTFHRFTVLTRLP